ncbi:importin subunit beta-1, partial [Tanacetum coccineum]
MQLFIRRQCLLLEPFAYSTGPDFAKYMPEFYKYLEMGLQNFEEYRVCVVTVGENFEKYLMYAMPMLQSATQLSSHTSGADDEMIEYQPFEKWWLNGQPAIQQVHLPQQSSCGDQEVLIVFQMARTLALQVAVEAIPPTQLLLTLQVQ